MKKVISILLALVIIVSVAAVPVFAVTESFKEGNDDSELYIPSLGLFPRYVKYYDGENLIGSVAATGDTYTVNYSAPAKEGYYFTGWYSNAALTTLSSGSISLKNLEEGQSQSVYAKYVAYSPSFNVDLTKYNLYNDFVDYGYFLNGAYKTGILNKGYAAKEYTSNGITVYSDGYNSAGADKSGNAYASDTSSWAEITPIIITNPDGSAFVPKPNTKYNITINYKYPSHGNADDKSYIDVFSGISNTYATESSMKNTTRDDLSETISSDRINLDTAFSGTNSAMLTITTENFDGHVPVLALFARSAAPKISTTKTSFTDASGTSKTGYKVESFSKIVISSITVTEASDTDRLKVTRIVRDEADILNGTAQIFLPKDGSVDYKFANNINAALAVFKYDANKQSYVLTENYAVDTNKKGVTVPAGGFAYIISKASNGYWGNLQTSYELVTGSDITGSAAYIYGADLDAQYVNSNNLDVTSTQFVTNAFISIGSAVSGQTAFDPTNKSIKLFGGGASVLIPDVYAQADKQQALRIYFKYKVNEDGTVTHNGEVVKLAQRGILIKSASKAVELTVENMDHKDVTVVKSSDFSKCWDFDRTNGIVTYSNHIVEIPDNAKKKGLVFRPFIKLENNEYILGDEVTYSAESVESDSAEWKELFSEVGNRKLVWSNEFINDTDLSTTDIAYSDVVQSDYEYRPNDSSTVRFENGAMCIITRPIDPKVDKGADKDDYFASAGLTTEGTMEYKYGYLEMRAQVPFCEGFWPSFWLKSEGEAQEYMDYFSEIDVFEVFGSLTSLKPTIHKWGPWRPASEGGRTHTANHFSKGYSFADNATALGWHTYGFEWNESEMKFYIDGVCYDSVSIKEEDDFDTQKLPGMGGFHDYHFFILTNGLFENSNNSETGFFYTKDTYDLEVSYTIDYIRLYQNATSEDFKTEF